MKNADGKKRGKGPSDLKEKAKSVWRILKEKYPDPQCALDFGNPLDLLVATILSAQCTDERVNIVTKDLFQKYRKLDDYLAVTQEELECDIRSTGFYKNKAKSIRGAARAIMDNFGGKVPGTLDELTRLPGVGRKTANVILGTAFGIPGITVDTHVGRLSRRIGLSANEDPVKVEFDLMDLIPQRDWTIFSHAMILHGRGICRSRKPDCASCPVAPHCDFFSAQS
jgi:endonuclease III